MTIIYSLSGIALNHKRDWNPSYVVEASEFRINKDLLIKGKLNKTSVLTILDTYAEGEHYKTHYQPNKKTLKVFIKNGSITINLETAKAKLEKTHRRLIFHQVNFMHYNPHKLWTIFSDIYAVSLFILAISGLFILKGKNGITGRGAWLVTIGIVIPIIFLLAFYWKVF